MWRLRAKSRKIFSCVLCVVTTCMLLSCGNGAVENSQYVSIDALLDNGKKFSGVSLMVNGCLRSNPHGLTIRKCASSELGVPVLFSERVPQQDRSMLVERTMKSEIETNKSLAITLCGTFSQTSDDKDRWLEVDSFSIDGRSYGSGSTCITNKRR